MEYINQYLKNGKDDEVYMSLHLAALSEEIETVKYKL